LRRRVLVAVILFLAVIVGLRVAWVGRDFDTVVAASAFESARDNHTELRAFLRRMPKGGDLHTHLAGAVYAERFIAWGAQERLCVNPADVLLSKPQCNRPGDVPAADAMRDQKLYDSLVNAFSTRAFVPTVAVPTDHDKFFAAFDKFAAASGTHFVEMTIDQLKEYHSENVQYVEFMTSFYCEDDHDRFIKAMAEQKDDAGRLAALQANGLDECVTAKRNELTADIDKIRSELACDPQRTRPGCGVTFRFIAQIGRNNPIDDVFLQTAIAAALIRAEPQVVALNLIQSEDNLIARRDYTRHMQIVAFLAKDVPVTLHAGEFWLGYVPPPDLTFHIRQAVEIANARRIGHGVDLAFEHDMDGLLADMRARHPRSTRQGPSAADLPRRRRAGRALDRRCRGVAHQPHQRIFPRCARLRPELPAAQGDRPQCVDPFLSRRGAKARGAGAVRSFLRRIRARSGEPAAAHSEPGRTGQGRGQSAVLTRRTP
jgi:adenosine deaminase